MKNKFDVVVIGGGIIGCSIAYYLAKENIDVAVLEAEQIGGKSTSAAAGMLGAHSECNDFEVFYPFARRSQLSYQSLQKELKELSGIDIEMRNRGIFQLVYSESEKKQLEKTLSLPTIKWVNPYELKEKEPHIPSNIYGAIYIEDDVNVLPSSACRGFGKSAQFLGATIFEYTNVYQIIKEENTHFIHTTAGIFEADYVVIANGVWSTSFFKQLGLKHELIPVKGECLSVRSNEVLLQHTLFHEHSYIVPRSNGQLVVGATMIANDWNEQPSLEGIESLISKAKTMLTSISNMKIESFWAGLRPQTIDQKPFIGFHPEDETILFATGHYRNGILLAPATGEMIRNLILKKEVNSDWFNAFKIDRLHSKEVKY